MKRSFTQEDIDRFLKDFKCLQNPYELEKVHQLLNNPNATARHTVKLNYKPFNFIIMTSAIVIGLSALLFWSGQNKTVDSNAFKIPDTGKEVLSDTVLSSSVSNHSKNRNNVIIAESAAKPEILPNVVIDPGLSGEGLSIIKDGDLNTSTTKRQEMPLFTIMKNERDSTLRLNTINCQWPGDTIIDKHLLLLDLTDSDLKNIGIARNGSSMFYHNIIEGKYDLEISYHPDLIPVEDRVTTYNRFYVLYITNSDFEPLETGAFYSSMDTLFPVKLNNSGGNILWLTPDEKLFSLLPEHYNYLNSTYKNLVCLKKKYPNRTFTNYLEDGKDRVLDPVNVLRLGKADLQKIGIRIDEESVIIQTINKNYTLKICKAGSYSTGNDMDSNIFPPNPFPVIMTDTLGRQVYISGRSFKKDSISKYLNILVPVRINFHDFVSTSKEVIICWYYPAEDFLKALPGNMGTGIKSEVLDIRNGSGGSTSSCNYFEACKSSIRLDDFKLYPNPANNSVTVEFQNSEEIIGSISIVNMAGLKLRELLPKTSFLTGYNSYNLNLAGISSGIYLISVNTQKGFKTQRLIIAR
jgi:hypothetical protein